MASLPPFQNLLAFEAVSRRRSFALAAAELNLTPSAISHQVARLEAFLGIRLLDRTTAGVRLTPEGERYLQRVGGALGALKAATRDARQGVRRSLYVHTSPSLASLWLMPRLADFARTHPDISLHLSASPEHSDFAAGQMDVDIRYGVPRWPNLVVEPLMRERVLPLASPDMVRAWRGAGPAGLVEAPLIQSTVSLVQWSDWFAVQGVPWEMDRFALRFDRAQLSLDAAVQGLGVALESATIAADHLKSGRLEVVFSPRLALAVEGHHVVYPERHRRRGEVQAFLAWLKQQAEAMADPLA